MAESPPAATLVQTGRPLSLIPVGLKEAALDSPTFRATIVHYCEQIDAVERWLESYIKAILKLSHEVSTLETLVNGFILHGAAPMHLSEAVVDHDYTLFAIQKFGEGAKDFWGSTIMGLKKLEPTMVEPIRGFLQNELRNFKDTRRQLDQAQKHLENLQSKYSAQAKSKDPSSLREDAFQLHEARKAYLKASMDFCVAAPQLRMSLDKMLVKVFFDRFRDLRATHENNTGAFLKVGQDLERIRGWSREMENGERAFKREIQAARKQIEDHAEYATRPSRELEDYSTSSTTAVGKGPSISILTSANQKAPQSEKQGWLNFRTLSGKPTRTMWVRRWFFVRNGTFGRLVQGSRSGGVEESERIGVMLCGVRPATQEERRFCFEVKTKDTTIVLQAETQMELTAWMGVFDAAKKKALEDHTEIESSTSSEPQGLCPAVTISPPSVPEFAASAVDSGIQLLSDDPSNTNIDRSATLPLPSGELGPLAARSSFDIANHRRLTINEKDGESSREQATRIIQKLDLHRKSTASPQLGINSPTFGNNQNSSSSGIASLISASHNVLPVGPGALPQSSSSDAQSTVATNTGLARILQPSTLAPSTLINPPAQTNLSTLAVIVNGERVIGSGTGDTTLGMSSGIMANLWGSSSWGYLNRFERGEVKQAEEIKTPLGTESLNTQALEPLPKAVSLSSEEQHRKASSIDPTTTLPDLPKFSASHRRTVSLDSDATDLKRSVVTPHEYPNYYPLQLKTQDAQFRLLFPEVKRQEKVVLVFRATWNPNDQKEFPGRVYVTTREIYFYSNHLGLVLITSIGLASILEVTAAPGRDCDFLFLHLKEASEKAEYTRITVKTFLEPLKMLQRRLNFLVQNCNADEPRDLESIMKTLIKFEQDQPTRSPSPESWEDTFAATSLGRSSSAQRNGSQRAARDYRTTVHIEKGLYGEDGKDVTRFKLPGQPVMYAPQGMTKCVVDKQFDISPKALFHILFGDRSAVSQLMYHERQARSIKQGPWTQYENKYLRRTFEYRIEYLDLLRRTQQAFITDTQTIDVQNDHLCYVVTDRKTPWHLPYHQNYMLVSKIVITHVAKSKCRLAIYIKVDWTKPPPTGKGMIERRALADLESDSLDLGDVVSDQVRKLGAQSRTKRAIQIFGYIGQVKEVTEFGASDTKLAAQVRRSMARRTLTRLLLESIGSFLKDVVTAILQWAGSLLRWIWKTGNANSLILLLLVASLAANTFYSSQETSNWWRERKAANYMNRLGVGPDLVMSKAVHVLDLDIAMSGTNQASSGVDNLANPCFQTFHSLASPSSSSSQNPTSRRLQHTRQQLGTYRHDLLVAIRVVNSIEREMMRVELEDWVREELGRCERMGGMLDGDAKVNETGEVSLERSDRKTRLEEYCHSCRAVV